MADISKLKLPNGNEYNLRDKLLLSRGEQLVVNGNGMLGDNTNFNRLVFDGSYSNNSPGSFTYLTPNKYINFTTQELFPINPDKCYEVEIDMITKNHLAYMYTYLAFYDVDKLNISVGDHGYYTGSDAVLTSSCDNNSTQITVDDASYYANLIGTKITISFWDYENSFGYKYPLHTYTRYHTNEVTIVGVSGNTITFSAKIGGSGVTHAAGTTISRTRYGGTYKYVAATGVYPNNTSWSHYRGFMEGVDFSGQNVNNKFPPGVAYARFGFLWNYTKKDDQVWVTNISVREYRDAYTVNGHTVEKNVPSDAVFTDTITTVTTSGSGNAITAISASNGAITATKGTTFLTSHQDISGKADKSATVSTVIWDSTNKKLTKTINGTTTDVVTAATLRTDLNVANGAEVNQNAFSNIKVGSTTIAADAKTDTVELVAGSNITLTPDATNDKVTIAATDTTYTAATSTPLMDGTAAVGTSVKYAREDHRHPTDTSRAPTNHASTATTYGTGTNANYGHVKLSDTISGSAAATSGGTAATPKAVSDAKTAATNHVIFSTTQPTNQAAGDYWFKLEEYITSDYQEVANAYGGNTAYISSTVQED